MFRMTAALNVPARATAQPQGGAGGAAPRSDLRGAELASVMAGLGSGAAAPVIPSTALQLAERTFSKGEYLYDVGGGADRAYIIETGLVALTLAAASDRQRVVALAGPGDVVGALAPNQSEHQSGAVALSGEVAVRVLPVAGGPTLTDEAQLASYMPNEFTHLLAAAAGAQIERLTWALEDSAHPVPARVARALLRLGQRFGHHTDDGAVRLTLPITHDTLASLVGAARETTTYTVQKLRERGLLAGTRGRYHFRPAALAAFAHESALAGR